MRDFGVTLPKFKGRKVSNKVGKKNVSKKKHEAKCLARLTYSTNGFAVG